MESEGDANGSLSSLQFGIVLRDDGTVSVIENGADAGRWATYEAGDVFRVGIFGRIGLFYRNGILIYKADAEPSYPVHVAATLHTTGSTIAKAKMSAETPPPPRAMPIPGL